MSDRPAMTTEQASSDHAASNFSIHESEVGASFGQTQSGYRLTFARDAARDESGVRPTRRRLPWLGRLARNRQDQGESPDPQRHYVVHIPISEIKPARITARRRFDLEDLEALARSLLDKGMLQPVLVRQIDNGGFQLLAGYRRWLAADLAGISEIPSIVIDRIGDGEALEFALIENLQRRDLTIMEEAEAHKTLIETFGRTHEQVAALVGKSRSHVSNTIRLLTLPEEVRQMLEDGRIAYGHARALLNAPDPLTIARGVADDNLTVRDAERLVAESREDSEARIIPLVRRTPRSGGLVPQPGIPLGPSDPADLDALRREIELLLGLKVDINLQSGRPSIWISATSPTQILSAARLLKDALELHSLTNLIKDASETAEMGELPLRSSR